MQYGWTLTRLSDGKSRQGSGRATHPLKARWDGTLAAAKSLQSAISKGKRQVGDFKLELRLPGVNGSDERILETAYLDLQSRLRAFRAVRVIALGNG